MNNTLKVIHSQDINEIESFFNYAFFDEIKEQVKNKRIKCCSEHINSALDEHMLTLCFTEYNNQCFKYNQAINIRLKGVNKIYPLYSYSGINYCMINDGGNI